MDSEISRSDAAAPREVARVRVIFGDTDQMGMVYYATYLRFFEIGRNEYLRQTGASYRAFEEAHELRLPVVEAHARYHMSARYDDEVVIATAVELRGAASVRFVYELSRGADGARLVSGWTVHACINAAGRVVRIPEPMREAVSARGRAP